MRGEVKKETPKKEMDNRLIIDKENVGVVISRIVL